MSIAAKNLVVVPFVAATLACGGAPQAGLHEVEVRMVAHDTTWQATYLIARPHGVEEIPTGREVHVPIGAEVVLALASRDYISDFALPGFGLRDFAAPGLPSELRFRATRPGRFDLRGDELCGRPHDERARGWLIVEDAEAYRAWVDRQARGWLG
jgi:heme/copper-type cytochrome/quinol oxidase subunit 2